jgi:catechol 2,3-dioxygenase-like lactoylglutathione lyase family enzyme
MQVLPRPDLPFGGAWLDAGNGKQIHLIEADVPPSLGQHVAFRVDDVEAVVAVLRNAGVEVSEAKNVAGTSVRQAFGRDPDGNMVEFTQAG